MPPQPRTLFGRTALTLAASMLLLLILTLGTVAYFILIPIGERSANDLAALVELSSQSWAELPSERRPQFVQQLEQRHGLRLHEVARHPPAEKAVPLLPYFYFFETALTQRLGTPIQLHQYPNESRWYWIDIPYNNSTIHMAISSARLRAQPPQALLLILLIGTIITASASIIIARRTTAPLATLAEAANRLGRGGAPHPISTEGPVELAALAHAFNEMALQINDLLENRTVVLSGISHDLRTPITRATLALEMLSSDTDSALIDGIRSDMEEMNHLITLFLEMSQGLSDNHTESLSLAELLNEVVVDAQRSGADIRLHYDDHKVIETNSVALKRTLTNLLENALRYGGNHPIEVSCQHLNQSIVIDVADRGPGIDPSEREAVFRPFYRLERSRSYHTGGSGLGLAIVLQLANRHGWSIELLERQGGGLVARLQLPLGSEG